MRARARAPPVLMNCGSHRRRDVHGHSYTYHRRLMLIPIAWSDGDEHDADNGTELLTCCVPRSNYPCNVRSCVIVWSADDVRVKWISFAEPCNVTSLGRMLSHIRHTVNTQEMRLAAYSAQTIPIECVPSSLMSWPFVVSHAINVTKVDDHPNYRQSCETNVIRCRVESHRKMPWCSVSALTEFVIVRHSTK